jgi:hypothetical protein
MRVLQRLPKLFFALAVELAPDGIEAESASVRGHSIDLLYYLAGHSNSNTLSRHLV